MTVIPHPCLRDEETCAFTLALCAEAPALGRSPFEIGALIDDVRRHLAPIGDLDGPTLGRDDAELLRRLVRMSSADDWREGRPHIRASNKTLADDMGCTPRTVQRALARLEAAGWLWRHYTTHNHRRPTERGAIGGIDLRPIAGRIEELEAVRDGRRQRRRAAHLGQMSCPHDSQSDMPIQIQNQTSNPSDCSASQETTEQTETSAGPEISEVAGAPSWSETPAPAEAKAIELLVAIEPQLETRDLSRSAEEFVRGVGVPVLDWRIAVERHGLAAAAAIVVGAVHDADVRNVVGFARAVFRKSPMSAEAVDWRSRANPWPRIWAIVRARGIEIAPAEVVESPPPLSSIAPYPVAAELARAKVYASPIELTALHRSTASETAEAVRAFIETRKGRQAAFPFSQSSERRPRFG